MDIYICCATLTSGFFASKTLGLDLDPMEARSRYGMRDEQEKTFMLQKGEQLHEDSLLEEWQDTLL